MGVAKRTGTRKLGWCLDGLHDQCIATTVSGNKCECPCHEEKS